MAKDKPINSATERPDYGEKGQPQPIAPNRTDAEGIDSATTPGAGLGIDPADATPHTTPEVTLPGYVDDQVIEEYGDKEGRLPHVLSSNFDVVRGEKVYRIPAGSVVKDTDLTDDEFDHALAIGIVREATVAELRAAEQREQRAADEERARAARREQVGVKPKKAHGNKAPAGATLVTDMAEDRAAGERARAARDIAAGGGR
jgi:hypothetical protein